MVLAFPGDVKLGQVDLINSWPGDNLFGWTQTVLQVSQYISVLLNQGSWEIKTKVTNEDPDPSVHALGI